MQDREIQQMRAEDKQYGEKLKGKKTPHAKPKNEKNFARYSMKQIREMEDEYDLQD